MATTNQNSVKTRKEVRVRVFSNSDYTSPSRPKIETTIEELLNEGFELRFFGAAEEVDVAVFVREVES